MVINELSKLSALSVGADLWVVGPINGSIWTKKLDWYLNFQIARTLHHENRPFSSFLYYVLMETGLPRFELNLKDLAHQGGYTLIAPNALLPTKYLVMVENGGGVDKWGIAIFNLWKNLHNPNLRVFLPEGFSVSEFRKSWLDLTDETNGFEFTLVSSFD